jgi:hypothetical protein
MPLTMFGTEAVFIPSIYISTIAATTCSGMIKVDFVTVVA